MEPDPKVLTARSSVGSWLEHPVGAPLIRRLLAQAGFDESVLAPVRELPLQQLVDLSQGQLSPDVVEDLVREANGGVLPADDAQEADYWEERITPGRFSGQTVIVTGAGSGIGRATASRIAREDGRVVAVDLAADRLDAVAEALDDRDLVTVAGDVTSTQDVERIVAAAGPRIDGLANVAGVSDDFSAIHEVSDAMWQRVFAVNVDGLVRLTRAVAPTMLAARRGSIVNVASEAALRGNAAGVAYTASKHAVLGITCSCAFMYGSEGIRANAVAPGGVATGMAAAGTPAAFGWNRIQPFMNLIPPIATAEHLAASITFLLSDDAVNISGAVLPSDGAWSVQ